MKTSWDMIVVGGGHAGIEAALAGARLGASTCLVTLARDEIGRLPCNPAIGGLGKGHLVREIDALGGEMGRAIDATGIQFRTLNRRKGPAVQAPRAQADKHAYQRYMMERILETGGLDLVEDEAVGLLTEDGGSRVTGVRCRSGLELAAPGVVLCNGTFLRGLMHVGPTKTRGGREGAGSSDGMSETLAGLGFELRRLKTGTPPRIARDSIAWERTKVQPGDDPPRPFSLWTGKLDVDQIDCHLTSTNEATHEVIRASLDRSPLFTGVINGQGPRYCPSVEDKVVRFSDRGQHLIFLEPEGRDSEEIYVNGFSTSLPADVQEAALRCVAGLEEARFIRYGYAVEYDSVPSWQVESSLQSKKVRGLYLAGQILGTSGYEEAAAQGLAAGVNCIRSLESMNPVIFSRQDSYMGVLIDDLVTKDISEPYRMFTSRAENRLYLRCDNVERRIVNYNKEIGIMASEYRASMKARIEAVDAVIRLLRSKRVNIGGAAIPAAEYLRRPEIDMATALEASDRNGGELRRELVDLLEGHDAGALLEQAQNDIKYEGYIQRQERELARHRRMSDAAIPADFDYDGIETISREAREKLARMRPQNLDQAERIDGVRAGDLAILSVLVQRHRGGVKS